MGIIVWVIMVVLIGFSMGGLLLSIIRSRRGMRGKKEVNS